jgi:hypothetical protein
MILLLACWLVLVAVPETKVARVLHVWLVAMPARKLDRITRGQVILVLALAIFVALVAWQLEGEGLRLLGMMAPEITTFVTMFEITTWLDVGVAAIATASVLRLRTIRDIVQARLPVRQSRARRTCKPRVPTNDDDGPEYSIAA